MVDDDRVLSLVVGNDSRTHGERLPAEIARALEEADVGRDQIDLLAVATGPGTSKLRSPTLAWPRPERASCFA